MCTGVAVRRVTLPHRYADSHATFGHTTEVTFPLLPQPKLVLDLATPEGYKAELT